jgi:hypothetical protein
MPTPGQELASIDFESMLGGPLVAVVNAQAQSAMATVNFIKEVGFKKATETDGSEKEIENPAEAETGEPIYIKFKYPKEISPYEPAEGDNPAKDAVWQTQILEVPILTILPIPYLRMEETTVEFNAKINSTSYRKTDSTFKINAETEAKAGWLWGSAKLKVSTSYQRNTQQGNTVNRNYSMRVFIKAVQDEMPAGMERLLGILEDAMKSRPEVSG